MDGCLFKCQEIEATYVLTVEDTECAYFDQVERLQGFGAQNEESIAQLVWGFFQYWAYYHNYKSDVISIRTATIIRYFMFYLFLKTIYLTIFYNLKFYIIACILKLQKSFPA